MPAHSKIMYIVKRTLKQIITNAKIAIAESRPMT